MSLEEVIEWHRLLVLQLGSSRGYLPSPSSAPYHFDENRGAEEAVTRGWLFPLDHTYAGGLGCHRFLVERSESHLSRIHRFHVKDAVPIPGPD
jgi:hypothetical protein